MRRSHFTRSRAWLCIAATLCAFTLARQPLLAAPTVFFASPSTFSKGMLHCEILARELPRQALLLTASEEMGWICIDSTLEPAKEPTPDQWRLTVQRFGSDKLDAVHLELRDESAIAGSTTQPATQSGTQPAGAASPLDAVDLKPQVQKNDSIDYRDLCVQSVALVKNKWAPLVAQHRGASRSPVKWDATLPAPEQSERLLKTIDFLHAFLATRAAHDAIRETGESPPRLGVLVRGYAHLGDATRFVPSAQSIAFFARAQLYAQRYVDRAPNDPLAYWHRAYAEALLGATVQAVEDIERGDELAKASKTTAPAWVDLTRDLLAFRWRALLEKSSDPENGAIAAYFAWMSIEHMPLQTTARRAANIALDKNPGALRTIDALSMAGGMRQRAQGAGESPIKLYDLVAELATDSATSEFVALAAQRATDAQFSTDAILKFLSELDDLDREPGQPLPWSTFASLVREMQYIHCFRSIAYLRYALGASPGPELERWWPLVKSHRYSALLASFDEKDTITDHAGTRERVAAIPWKDSGPSCCTLTQQLDALNIKDPVTNDILYWRFAVQGNDCTYDEAMALFGWRAFAEYQLNDRKAMEKCLLSISPNHPVGVSFGLLDDWTTMLPRAEQIERDLGDNPVVLASLGRAYSMVEDQDRARPFLERALREEKSIGAFKWLAFTYSVKKDTDNYLKVWNRCRAETDDIGLLDLAVGQEVVEYLLKVGEPARALPYAERAAGTGAGGGLYGLGDVYAALGRYDECIKMYRSGAVGYNQPMRLYMIARMLGHPAADDAATMCESVLPDMERRGVPAELFQAGVFYYLQRDYPRSLAAWSRADAQTKDPFYATAVAMQLWETGPPDQAKAALDHVVNMQVFENGWSGAYHAMGVELARCFNDPTAFPSEETVRKLLPMARQRAATRASIFYFAGRACELRGHNDEAKKWYRESLGENLRFPLRPVVAVALRRLGDEYYPPKK